MMKAQSTGLGLQECQSRLFSDSDSEYIMPKMIWKGERQWSSYRKTYQEFSQVVVLFLSLSLMKKSERGWREVEAVKEVLQSELQAARQTVRITRRSGHSTTIKMKSTPSCKASVGCGKYSDDYTSLGMGCATCTK